MSEDEGLTVRQREEEWRRLKKAATNMSQDSLAEDCEILISCCLPGR